MQFTAGRDLRDKIEQAKALLRHRVPNGDLATIVEQALTALIDQVKKERWGVGRRPRSRAIRSGEATSRHVPDAIKRIVYERDGGRCTFVDSKGTVCGEQAWLEVDHVEGFARRQDHSVEGLRLLCRAHNQHAADELYGRAFMERKRTRTLPGES